jgi:thioredoxin 1
MSEHVANFTGQNWEKEVLASGQPVLVDFFADWCGPCRAMAPDVEAVAQQYKGRLVVGKLNVDEQGEIAAKYGITAMPTLIVLKGGRVVDQRVGKLSKESLTRLVEPHLG